MQIIEPSGRVRFRSWHRLFEHVVKHVIEGRDERWHQVFDIELLADARREHRIGFVGRAFRAIAARYEQFVSGVLVRACTDGTGHRHLVRYRREIFDPSSEVVLSQVVEGYRQEEKLIFVAEIFENAGTSVPYCLLTAYRPCPNLSAQATRRKARERLRNRQSVRLYRLVAEHGF